MAKEAVQALKEGRSAWQIGALGFMLRFRGRVVSLLSSLALTVVFLSEPPFWVPDDFKSTIDVNIYGLITGTLLAVTAFLTLAFMYLRKRSIRSLDTKFHLHQLAHDIRDQHSRLHSKLSTIAEYSPQECSDDIERLLEKAVENIAVYFRTLTQKNRVAVAVRLYRLDPAFGQRSYHTYARSSGLSGQRRNHTEGISEEEGIPQFLRQKAKCHGILIYNDIDEAERLNAYRKTENDKNFPDEIKTMMVAPLNTGTGSQTTMIGLLYITSMDKGVFRPIHFDSVAFTADVLANAVANSLELAYHKLSQSPSGEEGNKYEKDQILV